MNYKKCIESLIKRGLPVTGPDDDSVWCNATFDTILCWPAIPANSTAHQKCPDIKGLDVTKHVEKHCHSTGMWAGRNRDEPLINSSIGYTDFLVCMQDEIMQMMMRLGTAENVQRAQMIARNTRILEFVGLTTSFLTLTISVIIFCSFRRLHVFRCLLHLQLCVAILCMVTCRLLLYVDLYTIGVLNSAPFVCEFFYFALEYFKTVAFAWTFLEGFYLHNTLVFSVFNSQPSMKKYTAVGFGVPLAHCMVWFVTVIWARQKVESCLGNYYMHPEYYVLDVPRMLELFVNFCFLCNVLRVLWSKVSESYNTSETEKMRKSVKAALMLIPLLGLPNITQTIPFSPTKDNLELFEVWMYFSSFLYMFQGAMVAILYCFMNKEVRTVVASSWHQHRMSKATMSTLNKTTAKRKSSAGLNNKRIMDDGNSSTRRANQTNDAMLCRSNVETNGKHNQVAFAHNASECVIYNSGDTATTLLKSADKLEANQPGTREDPVKDGTSHISNGRASSEREQLLADVNEIVTTL